MPSVHFQESMRRLSPILTFISLVIHFPFKWPRQEAKTKRHSQQQEAKSVRRRTALTQQNWRVVTGTLL